MAGTRDWDGATYDRIADPMTRWGAAVLDRLPLVGRETVLDAGCGSGRVTETLLDRLPGGRVIAADAAPSMLAEARRRLARFSDRVELVECDLGRPLPVGPVDAVFSTATFHWVPDHDALFRNLAAVLAPGGPLVAQCGGAGNVANVQAALDDMGETWPGPWTFATPEETAPRLAAAGFVDIETWLHDEPTVIDPGRAMETFLETVILRSHVDRLPEGERPAYVREVARRLPESRIDYVRLNIVARRAEAE
ncbi:MAG: methyltransferase domain-containing protein [Actinomycetota bacterium]|nr:methyltransferase domain-containing protein [Actinomycetota bacterium]